MISRDVIVKILKKNYPKKIEWSYKKKVYILVLQKVVIKEAFYLKIRMLLFISYIFEALGKSKNFIVLISLSV